MLKEFSKLLTAANECQLTVKDNKLNSKLKAIEGPEGQHLIISLTVIMNVYMNDIT